MNPLMFFRATVPTTLLLPFHHARTAADKGAGYAGVKGQTFDGADGQAEAFLWSACARLSSAP